MIERQTVEAVTAMRTCLRSQPGAVTDRQCAKALAAALTVLVSDSTLDSCINADDGMPYPERTKRWVRDWASAIAYTLADLHDIQVEGLPTPTRPLLPAHKPACATPTARTRMSEAVRAACSTPEYRARMSELSKAVWAARKEKQQANSVTRQVEEADGV